MKYNFVILTLIIFTSCTNKPAQDTDNFEPFSSDSVSNIEKEFPINSTPKFIISFEKVFDLSNVDYLNNSEVSFIRNFNSIDIDRWGRLYVANGAFGDAPQSIVVFSSEGKFIENIGRTGRGPGEFQFLHQIKIYGNNLYAYDELLKSIHVYEIHNPELEHSATHLYTVLLDPHNWRSIEKLNGNYVSGFYPLKDQTILMAFKEPYQGGVGDSERLIYYYLINKEGAIISDKVFYHEDSGLLDGYGIPSPSLNPVLPFTRSTRLEVSESGKIYTAWTEDFEIKIHNNKGKLLHSFSYPIMNSTLNKQDILDLYEDKSTVAKRKVLSMEFPETWPTLHKILLDDQDRIWVAVITDDEKNYDWWLTDKNGNLLGRFKWNGTRLMRNFEREGIIEIKGGFMYSLRIDKNSGEEVLSKYKIILERNTNHR